MPHKVLIIDDEAGFSRLVKMNLEKENEFEVLVENDSTKAHASASEFAPDVILLDIVMPGLDGGDVAALLKNDPNLQSIPIIMMTALMSPQEAGDSGFTFSSQEMVLPKPVKVDVLKTCLREAIAKSQENPDQIS